ncbi:MAG: hypothetical protein IJQ20_04455 [Paludibacteraceae bacterium]|nr:hypothetical protein [Paludibacteraceae bacterium]MBQ6984161.1 hypothetical protein [Paludibacteraceae bacterium]MBR6034604.1 hypothetical protein [Paludibacteraceae bacterium]
MESIIKKLNWIYYGQMVIALIVLSAMYYAFSKGLYEPLDRMSQTGQMVQYIIIFDALLTIPLGLYIVKYFKPQTPEKYFKLAATRILLVSNSMPLGIFAFYWMGGYKSMLWVAAIAAIAWYFSKPTLGKMEEEMKPQDPNEETY